MRKLWLAGLVVLAIGCGGGDGNDNTPTVEGQWSGTITTAEGSGDLGLTLNEGANGAVTGTGNLVVPGDALALTVTGNYSPPTVSLTMSSQGFEPMNLTGTVSSSAITGTLNGSGFVNISVTLDRQ
jgi:hypothetical protein